MNKCYVCDGKLRREKVNIARYWGSGLIALNDVPALVCEVCGERYFEAKVSEKVDQKIKQVTSSKISPQKINVPVVQF